jgi:sugar/nucleoside kinase (ribokinase family)
VPTALCSFVGADLPPDFRQFMASRGVELNEVITVDGYETSTVLIVSDSQENQVAYVYQGPMRDMGGFEVHMDAAREAKFVHISTGRPEHYLKVMKEARERSKDISFDPAQEVHRIWDQDTFRLALPLADRFFCNQNELRTALRYMGASGPEGLLQYVPTVINTRGGEGVVAFTGKGSWKVSPARPDRIVDPTGAGDAFRAGFYAGQYRGHGLLESMAYGNSAASYVLEARGSMTNIPTWEQVERRAGDILSALDR